MPKLTPEQQRVVAIDCGVNLVLAPAGSGKTELLAERVIQAIKNGHDTKKMACLTFTIRAGKNMLERVNERYPVNEVTIGNIHSVCANLLYKNAAISSDSQILDDEDSSNIMAEIARKHHLKGVEVIDLLKMATFITRLQFDFPKTHLQFPTEELFRNDLALAVVREYMNEKAINGYLDYDDLLTQAYLWMQKGNEQLEKFDWIQIDEVQDLNALQFDIIAGLCTKDATQVYFGDYNQAIYGFMGAQVDSIQRIMQNAGEQNIFYLTKNFRSPSYLLDLYNDFIRLNMNTQLAFTPIANNQLSAPRHALGIYNCSKHQEDQVIV